ncbi:hypothetical protein LZ30DRAFT_238456 [Colletotrichum cereale]|nr:hypothetical protein LZ30DRAFT_238456 [Colletotrichum cereale]
MRSFLTQRHHFHPATLPKCGLPARVFLVVGRLVDDHVPTKRYQVDSSSSSCRTMPCGFLPEISSMSGPAPHVTAYSSIRPGPPAARITLARCMHTRWETHRVLQPTLQLFLRAVIPSRSGSQPCRQSRSTWLTLTRPSVYTTKSAKPPLEAALGASTWARLEHQPSHTLTT